MRIVKATVVSILFLLIPHQAPFAGAEGDGQAMQGDPAPEAMSESAAGQSEQSRRGAVLSDEGFVWSVASSRGPGAAWTSSADHLQTDGYSWSARSAGSKPAADPAP